MKGIGLVNVDSSDYIILENKPVQKGELRYDATKDQSPEWYYYDSTKMTVTVTAKKDAGIYSAVFTTIGRYRFRNSSAISQTCTVSWEIKDQEIVSLPVQDPEHPLYYNGGTKNPTWLRRQSEKLTISGDTGSKKGPGTYWPIFTPKKNYCWSSAITKDSKAGIPVSWTINPGIIEEPSLSQTSFSYNNSYYDLTNSNIIQGEDLTVMIRSGVSRAKNNGSYWIIWTLKDDNLQWANTEGKEFKILWSIGMTVVPVPYATQTVFPYEKNQIYDISPYIENETEYITRHGNSEQSQAGDYQLWYELTDKGVNTIWSDNTKGYQYINWSIGAISVLRPSFKTGVKTEFDYDEKKHTIKLSDIQNYNSALMDIVVNQMEGTSIGTYTISFRLKDNNYKWSTVPYYDDTNLYWHINRKSILRPYILEAHRHNVYTGEPISVNIQNRPHPELVSQIGVDEATNIDSYTAIFSIDDPDNYQWKKETEEQQELDTEDIYLAWNIDTREIVKPTISGSSDISYSRTVVHGPVFNNYENQKKYITRSGTYEAEEPGNYTATFSLNTSMINNIKWQSDTQKNSVSLPWRIMGATIPAYNFEQDGTLEYDGTMLPVQITYYNSETHILEGDIEGSDVGYYTAYIIPRSPYCWSDNSRTAISVPWQIGLRSLTPPVAIPYEYDYTGSNITVTFSNNYENYCSITGRVASTVGTHTATFSLLSPENTRWEKSTNDRAPHSVEWKISQLLPYKPSLIRNNFDYEEGMTAINILSYLEPAYDPELMTTSGTVSKSTAGTFTGYVSPKPGKWKDGSSNTVILNWSISTTKMPSLKGELYQLEPIIYDTTNHTVQIANYDSKYHSLVSTFQSGTKTITSTLQGTEAKRYYVAYKPTNNYSWPDNTNGTKIVPWDIDKLQINNPEISSKRVFVYDGSNHTVTVRHAASTYITSQKGDNLVQKNIGNYKRTYSIGDKSVEFKNSESSTTLSWFIIKNGSLDSGTQKVMSEAGITSSEISVITSDIGIDKPESDTTLFTYSKGVTRQVGLKKDIDPTFVTAKSDTAINAGYYTATYTIDSTKGTWKDGSTTPVRIPWQIQRKPLDTKNCTFSQTQALRETSPRSYYYIKDYLRGYDSECHVLSGVDHQNTAGSYWVDIGLNSNYCWNDNSTDTKAFQWKIDPGKIELSLHIGNPDSSSVTRLTMNDSNKKVDLYVKSSIIGVFPECTPSNENISISDGDPINSYTTKYQITALHSGSCNLTVVTGNVNGAEGDSKTLNITINITTFQNSTWAQIKQKVDSGDIDNYFYVGETKEFEMSGTVGTVDITGKYLAVIIGRDHNDGLECDTTQDRRSLHLMIRNYSNKNTAYHNKDICFIDDLYNEENDNSGEPWFVFRNQELEGIEDTEEETPENASLYDYANVDKRGDEETAYGIDFPYDPNDPTMNIQPTATEIGAYLEYFESTDTGFTTPITRVYFYNSGTKDIIIVKHKFSSVDLIASQLPAGISVQEISRPATVTESVKQKIRITCSTTGLFCFGLSGKYGETTYYIPFVVESTNGKLYEPGRPTAGNGQIKFFLPLEGYKDITTTGMTLGIDTKSGTTYTKRERQMLTIVSNVNKNIQSSFDELNSTNYCFGQHEIAAEENGYAFTGYTVYAQSKGTDYVTFQQTGRTNAYGRLMINVVDDPKSSRTTTIMELKETDKTTVITEIIVSMTARTHDFIMISNVLEFNPKISFGAPDLGTIMFGKTTKNGSLYYKEAQITGFKTGSTFVQFIIPETISRTSATITINFRVTQGTFASGLSLSSRSLSIAGSTALFDVKTEITEPPQVLLTKDNVVTISEPSLSIETEDNYDYSIWTYEISKKKDNDIVDIQFSYEEDDLLIGDMKELRIET